MSTSTLTSLAILKVSIDDNKDYLDYLRPFVLQVLAEQEFFPITTGDVEHKIAERFGLAIPQRTVEIVLKRITRDPLGFLERRSRKYHRTSVIPDPGLVAKQAKIERDISSVVHGLMEFSTATHNPITSESNAMTAICTFLERFDIACLRTELRGTALPTLTSSRDDHVVLVAAFVEHILKVNPERFNSFSALVQGHMLANALTCPDLKDAPKLYRNVTFYLDTPLLIQLLGYEGNRKQEAVKELITLVRKSGGLITTFDHSVEEVRTVLNGAVNDLRRGNWDVPPSGVVVHARRGGVTPSDLQLSINKVASRLAQEEIDIISSPELSRGTSTRIREFENLLDQAILYRNPMSKELDVHSVATIYNIRGRRVPHTIEDAGAVLVTDNTILADTAATFAAKPTVRGRIPSVITDFALANSAWLKSPMDSTQIPRTQLLALSYAALQPSPSLLKRYLDQIADLEETGEIDVRDLQLLRDSPLAHNELVQYSLGVESTVTADLVATVRDNVYERQIRAEEAERIEAEQIEESRREQEQVRREMSRNHQRELRETEERYESRLQDLEVGLEELRRERDDALAVIADDRKLRYVRKARLRIWMTDLSVAVFVVGIIGVVELSELFGMELAHIRPWLRVLYGLCTVGSAIRPAREVFGSRGIATWYRSRLESRVEGYVKQSQ